MSDDRERFNPEDPHDIMCENFRQQAIDMFTNAESVTVFREMPMNMQLSCFLNGLTVAMLGTLFTLAKDSNESREHVYRTFEASLPLMRQQAEDMAKAILKTRRANRS